MASFDAATDSFNRPYLEDGGNQVPVQQHVSMQQTALPTGLGIVGCVALGLQDSPDGTNHAFKGQTAGFHGTACACGSPFVALGAHRPALLNRIIAYAGTTVCCRYLRERNVVDVDDASKQQLQFWWAQLSNRHQQYLQSMYHEAYGDWDTIFKFHVERGMDRWRSCSGLPKERRVNKAITHAFVEMPPWVSGQNPVARKSINSQKEPVLDENLTSE